MSGHQDASGPHAGQPVLHAAKPLGAAPVVVILVHGRGAGPENILDLVPALGVVDVTYLAPAAANRTWYPYGFMSDIAKNEPYLSSALSVLASLVARVEASGVARDHVVIGGFSQGACLTTEFAIRNASRFGGVVAFSGGAIGPPGTTWATENARAAEGTESAEDPRATEGTESAEDPRAAEGTESAEDPRAAEGTESAEDPRATEGTESTDSRPRNFNGTPIFFGCSDVDPHIPELRVRESAEVCARMGAEVTTRIYPGMGHLVNDDEIMWVKRLLDSLAS